MIFLYENSNSCTETKKDSMQIWTRLPSVSFQKKRQSSFWKKTLGMSLPRLLFLSWHPFKTNCLQEKKQKRERSFFFFPFVFFLQGLESVPRQCEIQPMTHAYFVKNTQHQRLLARNWIRCLIDTHRESIRISLWDWNSTSFKNLHYWKCEGGSKVFWKTTQGFRTGAGIFLIGRYNKAGLRIGWRSFFFSSFPPRV